MKCNYCGFESETNFIFCPSCGKEAPVEVYGDENPAANLVLNALKDKLFFVICILLTVGSAGALLAGNINVITILATVFAWLVYNSASKDHADAKNLRSLSGTVYAQYVIVNVVAVIIGICGIIFGVLFSTLFSASVFLGGLLEELEQELLNLFGTAELIAATSSVMIFIICLVVAVILFLFNFFGMKSIHRFVKSVYQSVENGLISFDKCKTARIWLMVFGIAGAVSALGELNSFSSLSFCSSAAIAAAEILASILIKKHFSDTD